MFRRLLKLTAKQISDDQLILLFRDLDLDDSGTLAMEELFEMLENPNWMPPPPEAREAATEAAAAAEELEEERRLAEAEEQRVRAERSREEEERSRLEEEAAQVSLGPHFPTILPAPHPTQLHSAAGGRGARATDCGRRRAEARGGAQRGGRYGGAVARRAARARAG